MDEQILKITNYLTARDNVQVTPDVLGVEMNDPTEFEEGTNHVSISRLTMNPNAGFERHVHPHNHVLVILKGSGFLFYRLKDGSEGRLDFTAGDVFNVPGTSEHAVTAGPDGIEMFSIGSPPMHLIDPERMVFVDEKNRWMVPKHLEHIEHHHHDDHGHNHDHSHGHSHN